MAEKSGFFISKNGDRKYDSEDIANYIKQFFTNGIFNDSLKVKANDNMTVNVSLGSAHIEGHVYELKDNELIFDISDSDTTLSRVDSVIVRLDIANRKIYTTVLNGAYATNPSQPSIIRTNSIYDLRLANISVPAGISRITNDLITDTRFSSDCGNVMQAVQTPDMTSLFEDCTKQVQNTINDIKNILNQETAGNLLNEINEVNNTLETCVYLGTCTDEELAEAIANSD